jgi:hypothetical protein
MMYQKGDRIKIRSWEDLTRIYKVNYFRLVKSEAITLPDKIDFSKGQYDRIIENCPDLIDEVDHVSEGLEWYHLKNSKTIITKYVIEYEVVDDKERIRDRFDILDL